MGLLGRLAIGVLAISFVTFVAFFGRLPTFRNTPIGFLHRVIWIHIPNLLGRLDEVVTGGKTGQRLSRFGDYLFYTKHPLVMIFFLGLVTASATLFLSTAWPSLSTSHRLVLYLLLPSPYLFTYLCQRSGPSAPQTITDANLSEHLDAYPYDMTLYYPGKKCRTCGFLKPARSKHCSLCGCCVARADHHCVWVNNCVGRGNYKYFLLLLLTTSLLLAYGAYLAWILLTPMVDEYFLRWPMLDRSQPTSLLDKHIFSRLNYVADILTAALTEGGISLTGVGLLAGLTSPLPFALLLYHLYLLWAGTTTSESSKWADLKDDMFYGHVHMATLRDDVPESYLPDSGEWPLRARQFVVRTAKSDGLPKQTEETFSEIVVEGSWRQVWRLAEVENIYDLGFLDNFWEAVRH